MNKRLVVIGAMDVEILHVREKMKENGKVKERNIQGFTFYEGKINKKNIVLVKSGVGRVNSAVLFTVLFTYFKGIERVINIGIAGGYGKVNIKDIVVCERSYYGDVDLTTFPKYVYGQMSSCPPYFEGDQYIINKIKENNLKCTFGSVCTNEAFMTDFNKAKTLVDTNFSDANILAFDMESAAYAQCARLFNLPFISIRAISDVVGDSEQALKYANVFEEACNKSNIFLFSLINIL